RKDSRKEKSTVQEEAGLPRRANDPFFSLRGVRTMFERLWRKLTGRRAAARKRQQAKPLVENLEEPTVPSATTHKPVHHAPHHVHHAKTHHVVKVKHHQQHHSNGKNQHP